MSNPQRAFTLIELLIVVAIIAILAAIAIPNFLEAQARSKISRSMTDMRTIATALEAYRVDSNVYPPPTSLQIGGLVALSTPVAYVSSVPKDPFGMDPPGYILYTYYQNAYVYGALRTQLEDGSDITHATGRRSYVLAARRGCQWSLAGRGPDRRLEPDGIGYPDFHLYDTTYDATNGTISRGDIERFGT